MNKINTILIILSIIVVVLLIWGFIGNSQAQDPGITCDFGIKDTLCWNWHTNTVGEINEFFNDLGNGS